MKGSVHYFCLFLQFNGLSGLSKIINKVLNLKKTKKIFKNDALFKQNGQSNLTAI
jgi:hypothetical protein